MQNNVNSKQNYPNRPTLNTDLWLISSKLLDYFSSNIKAIKILQSSEIENHHLYYLLASVTIRVSTNFNPAFNCCELHNLLLGFVVCA